MIKRRLQKQLLEDLREYPAVAITGARQTGKTTLAKQLMQKPETRAQYRPGVYAVSSLNS